MLKAELGFISIRNEDGTQYLGEDHMWGPRSFRLAHPISKFEELQKQVKDSKEKDCPDNGFFGLWNLTWHPCTQEEAHKQALLAAQYIRESEAADEELYNVIFGENCDR